VTTSLELTFTRTKEQQFNITTATWLWCPRLSSLDKRSWTRSLLENGHEEIVTTNGQFLPSHNSQPSLRLKTNKIQGFEIETKILLLQCGWDGYIVVFLCVVWYNTKPYSKSMQNSHKVFQGFFLNLYLNATISSHGRFLQHLKHPSAHGNLPPI
jgi:hypothetical protein